MPKLLRLSVVCLVVCAAAPASADLFDVVGSYVYTWEGAFVSGRISAMGGSDLADGGPSALLINPAPLPKANGVEASYDHADHYHETSGYRTYAGAARWNGWSLNLAMQDFESAATLRSLYVPGATSRALHSRNRVRLVGVSRDLSRMLGDDPSLRWSAGAAWCRHSSDDADLPDVVDTWDVGTTLRWRTENAGGWTAVAGAVSWRNVTDATLTVGTLQAPMPRPLRAGFTVERAFARRDRADDLVKILLACSRTFQLGDTYRGDTSHVGLEVLVRGTFALRYGHVAKTGGDVDSGGIGVVLDGRMLGPFTVEADLGRMSYDGATFSGDETIWGLRTRYDF